MARDSGEVITETNYEVKVAGPMDARLSVATKEDLYTGYFSDDEGNTKWTWKGMEVAVTDDGDNNGVWQLVDLENITNENGWDRVLTYAAAKEEGFKGDDGLSAYEIAKEHGYEGTEEEWLESLEGKKGNTGTGITNITIKEVED